MAFTAGAPSPFLTKGEDALTTESAGAQRDRHGAVDAAGYAHDGALPVEGGDHASEPVDDLRRSALAVHRERLG
jgi:hypothetical protein